MYSTTKVFSVLMILIVVTELNVKTVNIIICMCTRRYNTFSNQYGKFSNPELYILGVLWGDIIKINKDSHLIFFFFAT